LAQKADEELPELEATIAEQVAQYRRELKAHYLRTHILATRLDTVVTPAQIEAYYNANAEQFLAPAPLYQYYFIRTKNEDTPELRRRLPSQAPEDKRIIQEWVDAHAGDAKYNDTYVDVQTLRSLQPFFPAYNLLTIPRGAPVIVSVDYTTTPITLYFFYMRDVIQAGDPLPISQVANQIRALLLNQRKQELLKNYEAPYVTQIQLALQP
jgi:hypothetical protein